MEIWCNLRNVFETFLGQSNQHNVYNYDKVYNILIKNLIMINYATIMMWINVFLRKINIFLC